MKQKTILLIITIILALPLLSAQGNITNLVLNQPLPNFTAGETVNTTFGFDYPNWSWLYSQQEDNALLVLVVNISSNNSNYPVWKGDFKLWGAMNKINNFECFENNFSIVHSCSPNETIEIPNGTYYCTNGSFLGMKLDSHNEIFLNVKSHPALWPGKYNFSIGFFHLERGRTNLTVFPPFPDGNNGWYVTKPLFTLENPNAINIWYRWDSIADKLYNGSFGLENIPNAPPIESAGVLDLNWWSDMCGGESIQEKIFYVDLKDPLISNLFPLNNSIVYSNPRPLISAYLDEVYQSNSGINKNSIIMKVDGNIVGTSVIDAGSIDAIVNYLPSADLSEGTHNVSVYIEDNAGRNSSLEWFFYFNSSVSPLILTVNLPLSEIYESKRVSFNVSASRKVNKMEYINWNDKKPKWKQLCRNCNEYGLIRKKFILLNEGENDIAIRAVNGYGYMDEKNVSLFIDSKKPKISKILPRRNNVINGSEFYIKYSEDNLKEVSVVWNPVEVLQDCNESGINKECSVGINLSLYDGKWIDYYFNVSDIVRSVQSRETRVLVDTTLPVLKVYLPFNKTGNESYGRKISFNITISEDVNLEYYDKSDARPKWTRICTRCNEYGFDKVKTILFKKGVHDILIRAVDKAGNSDTKEIEFKVDY